MLTPLAAGLWVEAAPQSLFGLQIGTRMTIVRLAGGGLLVHSPIPLTEGRRAEVAALGTVTHIVAPNAYHHLHAGDWVAAHPEAVVHGPQSLRAKRRDLRVDRLLSDPAHPDLAGVLELLPIFGSMLDETVFIHGPTRTLVSSDLVENQNTVEHLPTRLYLKLSGVYQRVGWPRPLRLMYRDRAAARRSVDALLEHDFDRAIIAHGDVIESNARDAIREGLAFLG